MTSGFLQLESTLHRDTDNSNLRYKSGRLLVTVL
jgi:hypothetical protein